MSKFKLSDIDFNPYSGKYTFRGTVISHKCEQLFRKMILNDRDKCQITYKDVSGVSRTEFLDMVEISMIDGLFEWDHELVLPPTPQPVYSTNPCFWPGKHDFKTFYWTTYYIRECKLCGYSPELDASKVHFEKCHQEFLVYEKEQLEKAARRN